MMTVLLLHVQRVTLLISLPNGWDSRWWRQRIPATRAMMMVLSMTVLHQSTLGLLLLLLLVQIFILQHIQRVVAAMTLAVMTVIVMCHSQGKRIAMTRTTQLTIAVTIAAAIVVVVAATSHEHDVVVTIELMRIMTAAAAASSRKLVVTAEQVVAKLHVTIIVIMLGVALVAELVGLGGMMQDGRHGIATALVF
jgi:hypothetical protein